MKKRVVSAHRTPDLLFEYAESAKDRDIKVIIAGAGGAAHLPGMTAAKTIVPVIGVPIQSKALNGMDFVIIDCSNAWWRTGCNGCDRKKLARSMPVC
ncbi:AIR carboxylase family protein [Peribacillus frigoritolerans]|nr:AIR carboxylase family protein [Peribacillus frigoritolerans]